MMGLGAPHLSREFYKFTKALGECRSKEEEERIVISEIASLKQLFIQKDVDKDNMKEYLVRAIYVEMLGFEAPFAHIHAINMAQEKSLQCKMAGYLACRQLLKPESELMLLLINTIQKDLHSPNYIEVKCALQCICDLVNRDMLPIILPRVVECLDSDNEFVRKHAIMAIRRFHEFDNGCVNNLTQIIERGICDSDPSVMGCTLSLLQDALAVKPRGYRNLVPSLVSIMNQIIANRLPSTYNYHKVPAPWIQIAIISIFGKMGRGSKAPKAQICECLRNVLQQLETLPSSYGLISSAIVSECSRTIAAISADEAVTRMCSLSVSRMLASENNNMRYAGVVGLTTLLAVDVSYASENQLAVVACLEDRDETIRRCTLDLLYRMTNAKNVCTIVKCFIDQLRFKSEHHRNMELVNKVSLLCEKFAPSAIWYLNTVIELMTLTQDYVKEDIVLNTLNVLKENMEDEEFRGDVLRKMDDLVKDAENQPDIILKVISWVYANYPTCSQEEGSSVSDLEDYMKILVKFLTLPRRENSTICWILGNLRTLVIASGYKVPEEVHSVISQLEYSNCVNVTQSCKEIRVLCDIKPELDSPPEEFDSTLSFLNDFVQDSLSNGSKPYERPPTPEQKETEESESSVTGELRFKPYVMDTAAMETYKETITIADITAEEIVADDVPKSWGPSGYVGTDEIAAAAETLPEPVDDGSVQAEPTIDMNIISKASGAKKAPEKEVYVWKQNAKPAVNKEQVEMARALFQGLDISADDGGSED